MTSTRPPRSSTWRTLRDRTPLRTRLVVTVLILAAAVVMLTSLVAAAVLRDYLLDRVDAQLSQSAEQIADGPRPEGRPGPGPRGFRPPAEYAVQGFDDSGQPSWSVGTGGGSDGSGPDLPTLDAGTVAQRAGEPFTVDAADGQGSWRIVALLQSGGGSVAVGLPLGDVEATLGRLLRIDGIVVVLALAGLAGAAWWIVRASLKPLAEVEATAEAIAAGDLGRRVPEHDPRTEVGRLSTALNAMLGQIEAAFDARRASEAAARSSEERMRRFVADASHELRTPLTSIRGFSELYRQGAVNDRTGLDRAMRRIEEEATRMGMLVDDLLLLARLDQQRPLDRTPVDLVLLATDAVLDARAVARGHDLRIEIAGEGSTVVLGDEFRLRQVVANLIANAVGHTPAGTAVVVAVGHETDGRVALEVSDNGSGLAADDAERVFERFYRADPARTRSAANGPSGGGSGLGLSIVAALVAAHGGQVAARAAPDGGATFRVAFPGLTPG